VQIIRQRLRAFTWIAMFAMFGLALVPTISHALDANTAANPWAQVCYTPGGGGSGSPTQPGGLSHLDHCPLCGHGAGPLGMPPSATAGVPVPSREAFVAPCHGVAAAHLDTWAAAQPRAPPFFS
jgi:hypothetical protein